MSKKFGQNWVSNRQDIPDMDKFRQDIWCLDQCHCDSRNLFKMVPGTQVWSKWGQLEQRYSRYGQMLPGQMLPGQMLPGQMPSWQFESVRMNIPLKFRQNKASNNWDIADIEFLWWVVVYSHFHAKPKPRLGWVEDGLGFWQNPGFIS